MIKLILFILLTTTSALAQYSGPAPCSSSGGSGCTVTTGPTGSVTIPNALLTSGCPPTIGVTQVCVKSYGAIGNGIADDTTAFQSAITALATTGGTIWVPDGTYLLNGALQDTSGANAVLVMPHVAYVQTPTNIPPIAITISGLTRPTGGTANGAILQTSVTSGNLIGGYYNAGGMPPFTNIWLHLANLTLRATPDPAITMVNATNIVSLTMENVWCDTGYPGGLQAGVNTPNAWTHPNGVCAALPQTDNDVSIILNNVVAYGFYTGIIAREHSHLDNVEALFCRTGFVFDGNAQLSFSHPLFADRIHTQGCYYGISAASQTRINISELDTESTTSVDIYDPNNYMFGMIANANGDNSYDFAVGAKNLLIFNLFNIAQNQIFGGLGWQLGSLVYATPNIGISVVRSDSLVRIYPKVSIAGVNYAGLDSMDVPNFTGKSVTTRVPVVVKGSSNTVRAYLAVGPAAYVGIYYAADGTITMLSEGAVIASRAYNAISDLYWRIREASGTWYADTSADGLIWVNLGSSTPSFPANANIVIGIAAGTASSIVAPGYVQFDRFSVQ